MVNMASGVGHWRVRLTTRSRATWRRYSRGAFHYAKYSDNFGRNSNGKVRFGFFWPEYSGSPLEVVHIFRSEIFRPKFAVPFLTNRFFALIREFVIEFKMTTAISISWPDLIGKCRSIFLRYFHWSLTGQFGVMESTLVYSVYIHLIHRTSILQSCDTCQ